MTTYQRLGDHIREVNVRNRDLKVTKLVGLTIDKAFIPSVANVIGFENLRVIIPLDDMMLKFHEQVSPVFSVIYLKQKENLNLTELQSLLLAKMGKFKQQGYVGREE